MEENILLLDIGEQYIKGTLITLNWSNKLEIIQSVSILSKGIRNGYIDNIFELTSCINNIIYQIEIDTNIKIKSILVIISFCRISGQQYIQKLEVNGIVTQEDLELFNKKDYNNKYILCNLSSDFTVNNNLVLNPLSMECSTLYKNNYTVMCDTIIIDNLQHIFKKLNIRIKDIIHNFQLIPSFIQSDYLYIDIGYSSTRVLYSQNNKLFTSFLSVGVKYLYETLWEYNMEPMLFFNNKYEEHVNVTRNFFIQLINTIFNQINKELKDDGFMKVDIPIYLSGGITHLHALEFVLEEYFDRSFKIIRPNISMCTTKNNLFFTNNYIAWVTLLNSE